MPVCAHARVRPLLALLLVCFAAAARAQDSTRVVPVDTLSITVTRGRTDLSHVPAAVTLLTRDRIQGGRMTLSLDEPLAEVPGVLVNNRYNFEVGTRISIRGFGSRAAFGVRGIRLIADGIPLTMPDGQSNLNNLDLASTGRIEVLRGAASMLYGNAAGGVIDLQSERPAAGFSTEARALAGNLGRGGFANMAKLNVKLGGGSDAMRYLVSGARVDWDGYRRHSRFQQTNVNARVEHTSASAARTALVLNVAAAPIAENPGALPGDSVLRDRLMAWPRNLAMNVHEASSQLQAGITRAQRVGTAQLEASVYGLTRRLDNPLPSAYVDLHRQAGGLRSSLAWPHFMLGLDVEAQNDSREEHENKAGVRGAMRRDQTDRVANVGPFARVSIALMPRLQFTAGVRYDRANFRVDDHFLADGRDDSGHRTMSAFSPSAGLSYVLGAGGMLYGSVSTSFQTPTTTEMINTPPAPGQPCCAAGFNPLDPERAASVEVGMRRTWSGKLQFDAAIYQMRIRDELVSFQVPGAEGRDFFRNAGRTRHRGFELATSAEVAPALRVLTSYTYSHFIFEDDGLPAVHYEGKRLPGIPPHHLLLRGTATLRDVIVEPEAEWTAQYFANDANTPDARNASATVVNLRMRPARVLPGGLNPFAAIDNVFNARYNSSVVINAAAARYFEPAPGRSFYVGLAVRAGSGGLLP